MTKILFLDLDGTIREPISDSIFINDPTDQRLIKGVRENIEIYPEHIKIGVTDQDGVAAGKKSLENAIKEQQITLHLLPELQGIYFCPDLQGLQCYYVSLDRVVAVHEQWLKYSYLTGTYKKPNPGMIELAIARFSGGYDHALRVDRRECLMIGDREEDRLCAKAAGVPFMWACDWLRD